MQAIVIHEGGGPEVLKYEEVPDPTAPTGRCSSGSRLRGSTTST